MKLSRLGEFGLIERIRHKHAGGRGVLLGIGDDAAWIAHRRGSSLVTADLLIEGIHFDLRWTTLSDLGYKALAVNLSDIAAMGGVPAYVVLSLGIPASFDSKDIDRLYRGIDSLAKKHQVAIVGGDTNIAASLIVSVCVIGHPPKKPICRSGAQVGDDIYVTGTLGDAALGLSLLRRRRPIAGRAAAQLLKRHHRPTPRLAVGAMLGTRHLPSAMIDISDGLIQDLGHICAASGVGATVHQERLPLSPAYRKLAGPLSTQCALSGGEDYELLFCAAPKRRTAIDRLSRQTGVAISRIGTCMPAANGLRVIDGQGTALAVKAGGGHDHFKKN